MKKKNIYLIAIFLIVISCIPLTRIAGNDFINLDDDLYITDNTFIKTGINSTSIQWAFTNRDTTMWQPITWILLQIEWCLWGNNAAGYHIVSVLLHCGTTVFMFLFLFRSTRELWPSVFASVFFAVHPLRVESVAWAAEQKDVLSMFFAMSCLYSYVFYVGNRTLWRYLICLMLFSFALMSKSVVITLPFVLILIDYWPLERIQKNFGSCRFKTVKKLLWEKVPFLILSTISGILTIWAQYDQSSLNPLSFPWRVVNAVISYAIYLKKIFFPLDLALLYPFTSSFSFLQFLSSALLLICITVFTVYFIRRLPFLAVGWFWYVGTLVPMIGLVPTNSPIAAHYTYLPSIGIAVMLSWSIAHVIRMKIIRKKILVPSVTAILLIMGCLTWLECGYWKNSITLFSHTLEVTKENYLAHNNRGVAYNELGQYQRAIDDYSEAIHLKPDYAAAYNNRGIVYYKMGRHQQAIDDYNEAIRLDPHYKHAYLNRALYYFNNGDCRRGCADAEKACWLGICDLFELAFKKRICK